MENGFSQYQQSADATWKGLPWLMVCILLLPVLGCNSFGSGKLVQQLQNENERLLTEFRAERQRREESERLNATLEARLSESEKLLARQTQGTVPNRLSSLQPSLSKPLGQLPGTQASGATPNSSGANSNSGGIPGSESEFRWQRRVN